MFEYTLTRSKRKTLGLYIRNGALEVRMPLNAPKKDIDNFIASKAEWIQDKLEHSKEQLKNREEFRLDYGDTVLCLGKNTLLFQKKENRLALMMNISTCHKFIIKSDKIRLYSDISYACKA